MLVVTKETRKEHIVTPIQTLGVRSDFISFLFLMANSYENFDGHTVKVRTELLNGLTYGYTAK